MQSLQKQEPVGLLIAAARRRIKEAVGRRVRPHGLTHQQFWLLVALHEGARPSLGQVARRQRIDAPTASRVVALLRGRGLVRVDTDPADRRRSRLGLTPRGAALAARVSPLARQVRSAVVRGLASREVDGLRRLLRRVMTNMDRFEEGAARSTGRGRPRRKR